MALTDSSGPSVPALSSDQRREDVPRSPVACSCSLCSHVAGCEWLCAARAAAGSSSVCRHSPLAASAHVRTTAAARHQRLAVVLCCAGGSRLALGVAAFALGCLGAGGHGAAGLTRKVQADHRRPPPPLCSVEPPPSGCSYPPHPRPQTMVERNKCSINTRCGEHRLRASKGGSGAARFFVSRWRHAQMAKARQTMEKKELAALQCAATRLHSDSGRVVGWPRGQQGGHDARIARAVGRCRELAGASYSVCSDLCAQRLCPMAW
jgi:hypothetical protein